MLIPHLEINAIDDRRCSRQLIIDRNSMTANRTTITYFNNDVYLYISCQKLIFMSIIQKLRLKY
jgi:hypothetical protein